VPNLKPVVDCQRPALDDDKSTVGSIKDNKPGLGMSNESAPIVDSELMNEIEKASLATAVEDLTVVASNDNFRMNTGYGRYGAAYNMVGLHCFNEELSLLPKNPTEAKLQATSTQGESTEPT
jgi:hypothetical protein